MHLNLGNGFRLFFTLGEKILISKGDKVVRISKQFSYFQENQYTDTKIVPNKTSKCSANRRVLPIPKRSASRRLRLFLGKLLELSGEYQHPHLPRRQDPQHIWDEMFPHEPRWYYRHCWRLKAIQTVLVDKPIRRAIRDTNRRTQKRTSEIMSETGQAQRELFVLLWVVNRR